MYSGAPSALACDSSAEKHLGTASRTLTDLLHLHASASLPTAGRHLADGCRRGHRGVAQRELARAEEQRGLQQQQQQLRHGLAGLPGGRPVGARSAKAHVVEGARESACEQPDVSVYAGQPRMLGAQQPGSFIWLETASARINRQTFCCSCMPLDSTQQPLCTHRLRRRRAGSAPGKTARRFAPPLRCEQRALSPAPSRRRACAPQMRRREHNCRAH